MRLIYQLKLLSRQFKKTQEILPESKSKVEIRESKSEVWIARRESCCKGGFDEEDHVGILAEGANMSETEGRCRKGIDGGSMLAGVNKETGGGEILAGVHRVGEWLLCAREE